MKLSKLFSVMFLFFLLTSSIVQASTKAEIYTDLQFVLTAFYNLSLGNKELATKAAGILALPSVMKAGFFVGGDYNETACWP